METMNLNSREAYKKMTEASKDWSEWAEKAIVLDESRKAMFSKLFLKYKIDTKTVIEAEHKARTDPEYKKIIESYAYAESQLIKAKLMYNNLDRYLSVRQTENLVRILKKGFKQTAKLKDPNLISVENQLSEKLGMRVYLSNKKNNSGKLTFEFKGLDQLDRLINTIKNNY